MSTGSKTKKIDKMEVTVFQFGGIQAFKIHAKLLKLVAPGLAEGAGVIENGLNGDLNFSKLALGAEMLAASLDSDEGFQLIIDMLELTAVEGVKVDDKGKFDQVFAAGKMTSLYKILYFVIEVNYPDFFEMAGSAVGSLKSLMTKSSDSAKSES